MDVLGLGSDRFEATLLAALDNFSAAVAAAVEAGAGRIEPSHVLIALARIPGGLANSLFARSDIPIDVFVDALRREADPERADLVIAFTASTVSAATRATFADLAGQGAGGPIGDRTMLAALLAHLEPIARKLLVDYGGVDLTQWLAEAAAEPPEPLDVFTTEGQVVLEAFTPGAQRLLSTLVTQASTLGIRELGTLLLLHAMAVEPNGLLAQACRFQRRNLAELRTQMLRLLGNGMARPEFDVTLAGDAIGPSLRLALEKSAVHAARRRADLIGEQDLLSALLDSSVGPIDEVLRAAGLDLGELRQYAVSLYTATPEPEPTPEPDSVERSLEWLRENLIGQDNVLDLLVPRLELIKRAARRGFRMGQRPLATFLFCGPSGSGKTMTARLVAKVIYGSQDDLIVFDMGQFNSRHSMNNFIGASPGYVGFGEGQLTNGLRHNPRRVLLFDEVEKAHPLVLDALLRLLDEGQVNDPAGPVCDARDSVVVLTSNLGAKEFDLLGRRRALEAFFRPEFLNRIDEVILFSPFGPAELEAIAVAGLRRLAAELSSGLGVELSWDADVPRHLVRTATRLRVDEAARGVNRCIDEVLQLVLRALDDAEDGARALKAARAILDGDRLAVVRADV